ncbi:fibronectin type III domain-containing protein [Flavivirga algicola]|uniref:fibronectin type III domain-containing protein n=1 Tax=Flavivirga algicola TaxID=2729136 RepID=UPI001F0FC094|nr:fibronectin type III domain-containing protein [Flavivirga algicola]
MKTIIKITLLLVYSATFAQFDSDYQAILDEATTQGYTLPSAADQSIQNQIVVSAKANGIWATSDLILYFKGSGDKNFKLINWKNPTGTKATEEDFGGTLTWTSTGVKGDGLNLIKTGFNPTSSGLNYLQNDAGVYVKVTQAYTTKHNVFGGANVSLNTLFQRPSINSDSSLAPIFTYPGTGLLGLSRNNATSFIASVDATLTTLTHNSGSITNEELKVLGNGAANNAFTKFDGEVAYVIIGSDMSDKLPDMATTFDSASGGDTELPTTPTLLPNEDKTETTVDLSWTASTDNVAVTGYKVYKDDVLEATLNNVLTYQVTGLTAFTAYNFNVSALDEAGNESAYSNVLGVTTNNTSGSSGTSGNWTLNNQNVYYNTGNVGIGTTTPDEKLAVNGTIHTKEVRVDLDGWSDFVFEKDYKLPTLKEVEKHIKEKGHLKDIPSAKNVEEHGILLGDMNAKLLQKIEELTLYIIQQQKTLKEQDHKNEMQEKRLAELEKLTKQ